MTNSRPLTRRHWLLLAGAGMISASSLAAPVPLPTSIALGPELTTALTHQQPLVVMISLEGCPFFKIVRENYLVPLRKREGLVVVQIDMHNNAKVSDFRGREWKHDDLIHSWRIQDAPTVLFFGKGGSEVADRMVGGYIPDFYGAYLDERLRVARNALKS